MLAKTPEAKRGFTKTRRSLLKAASALGVASVMAVSGVDQFAAPKKAYAQAVMIIDNESATPANGKIKLPWIPLLYSATARYTLQQPGGIAAKLRDVAINLGLPTADTVFKANQHVKDSQLTNKVGSLERGFCPGVPRAAILGPAIDKPVTIAGVRFEVLEARGVSTLYYYAAVTNPDMDFGTNRYPFSPRQFHALNTALKEQGIVYGLNTKEVNAEQPWWRPAHSTSYSQRGSIVEGWVDVADYLFPNQPSTLKNLRRYFTYNLATDTWIQRDRIWAGFQVNPDLNQLDPRYKGILEWYNRDAAALVIGIKKLAPGFEYLYS